MCVLSLWLLATATYITADDQPLNSSTTSLVSSSDKHTLYLLVLLSFHYPELPRAGQRAWDRGAELLPSVRLAVEMVNNRRDILGDFQLEIVPADSGCNYNTRGAEQYIREVLHSGRQIVGAIGPHCTHAADRVLALTGREGLDLIGVHLSASPLMNDREAYPNAFGVAGSASSYGQLFASINEFTKGINSIALLYEISPSVSFDPTYSMISDNTADFGISFLSQVDDAFIPLTGAVNSGARVFVLSTGEQLTRRILCLCYHQNIHFPSFQFILLFGAITAQDEQFYFQEALIQCTRDEMLTVMNASLIMTPRLIPLDLNATTSSGLSYRQFQTLYDERLDRPANQTESVFAAAAFDAVWSLSLCLNQTHETLLVNNGSLAEYRRGKPLISNIVRHCFKNISFDGISGVINYNQDAGFAPRPLDVTQVVHDQTKLRGYIHDGNFTQVEALVIIPDMERNEILKVHAIVSSLLMVVGIIQVLFVISLHVLHVAYRERPSVKSSSPKINLLVFAGSYYLLMTVFLYALLHAYTPHHILINSVLCNLTRIWLSGIGFAVTLSALLVRTWRIYRIHSASKSLRKTGALISDPFLLSTAVVFILVYMFYALIWIVIAPYQATFNVQSLRVINEGGRADKITTIVSLELQCESLSTYPLILELIGDCYNGSLALVLFIIVFLSRKFKLKDFRPNRILILVGVLLFSYALSILFSVINSENQLNRNVTYLITVLPLQLYVLTCSLMVLLPPVLPVLFKCRLNVKYKLNTVPTTTALPVIEITSFN